MAPKSRKKKDISIFGYVKIAALVIAVIIIAVLSMLLMADFNYTADRYNSIADRDNNKGINSKERFNQYLTFEAGKITFDKDKQNEDSGGSGTSLGSGNASFSDGELQADVATARVDNQYNLPLYNGWTFSEDKLKEIARSKGIDESYIIYWDTDYSQFWKDETFKETPLYRLGDCTGTWNATKQDGSHGMIFTTESGKVSDPAKEDYKFRYGTNQTKPYLQGLQKQHWSTPNDMFALSERITVCLPWRVSGYRPNLTNAIETKLKSDEGLTFNTPKGNGTLTYNQFENMIHGDVPGFWTTDVCAGFYVDCLLDDGNVVPFIISDFKGIHCGQVTSSEWAHDTLCEGYATLRWSVQDETKPGLFHLIEVGGGNNSTLKPLFQDRKIVGFRTYSVRPVINGVQVDWMKEAGWDVSISPNTTYP